MKCLPSGQGCKGNHVESTISAVRLQISVNDDKGCRKIALKGIYGDKLILKQFVDAYKKKLQFLSKKDEERPKKNKQS